MNERDTLDQICGMLNQLITDFPETKRLFTERTLVEINGTNVDQKYICLRPADDDYCSTDPNQKWLITVTGILTAIGRVIYPNGKVRLASKYEDGELVGFAVYEFEDTNN